ncbi:hypothetical protein MMC24_003422 [Lignoscripta atroalba]|nr:hypothetical protein [Lignoscripta atroalba]
MVEQMHINCPQPIKPLKRKLSQLGLLTEANPTASKRSKDSCSTLQSRVEDWLVDSSSRSQNRSDTCLVFKTPKELGSQRCRSDSFISTRNDWKSTASMSQQPPYAPLTPLSSTVSTSSQRDRVKLPGYRRDVLEPHGIYIDPYNRQVPEQITNIAHQVLYKPRTSPPLVNNQIEDLRSNLHETINMKEADSKMKIRSKMFPTGNYGGRLVSTMEPVLSVEGLPHHQYVQQPVVQPKPDLSYGYHKNAFSQPQAFLQQSTALSSYAIPNTEYYWPFFHIEFKSQSRGGTHWVAENQNAGNGTHSVKSMETLLEYAKYNPKRHHQIGDSVAFSCCIDSEYATLWVHWVDKSQDKESNTPHYVSSYLGTYVFRDTTQLLEFRKHTKNIIEHGLDQRLSKIKQALSDIMLFDPEWTARMKSSSSRGRKRSVAGDSLASGPTNSQRSQGRR